MRNRIRILPALLTDITSAVAGVVGPVRAQTTEAVTHTTPTGVLSGTLQFPAGAGAHPLVAIIAGSGPTDRNGNTVGMPSGADAYRLLADSLAAHGEPVGRALGRAGLG